MGSCGRDDIAKNIITLLREAGPLTSREIIREIERMTECSAPPTLIREALAHLVREGLVLKMPGTGRNKSVFVFQLSPHALDAIQ